MSDRLGPVKILGAEATDDSTTVRLADGREFLDANIAIPAEQVEQIRQGYRCIRCLEPQSEPFPPLCESKLPNGQFWCNFPIREKQAAEFDQMYKGEIHIGSRVNHADELAALEELDKFERTGRMGIVVPRGFKKGL